jgi:3-phosphoglycerate kinase
LALEILRLAKEKVHIPVDVIAADSFSNTANTQTVDVNEILMVGKVWTQVQNHWTVQK